MGNIFKKYECFGLELSTVDSPLDLRIVRKPIRRQDAGSSFDLEDPKLINADPFLFVHDNRLFLFYEETTFHRPAGRLMMVSSKDLKTWTDPIQISNDDNLHFSFPFVFKDNAEVYMIPETGWVGEIRLYKAVDQALTHFELDTILMRREQKDDNIIFDYADNVLYKKDGIYYMFTSILDKDGYKLMLYSSSNLRGPYTEHPSSPICHSHKYGRNAGSIIDYEGRLFRPTQDCSNSYGGQVNLMEITCLSTEKYKETVFSENVLPQSDSFYRLGGHQLNYVEFKHRKIVATDAKRDRSFPLLRVVEKIKRILGLKV